jgi:hypothetical protein
MEQHRSGDNEGIRIDRTIPLWGILGLSGAIVGQAALVWSGQREQAIEMRHQAQKIQELTVEVKSLSAQLSGKDAKDLEQDARLSDMGRRIDAIDRTQGVRK